MCMVDRQTLLNSSVCTIRNTVCKSKTKQKKWKMKNHWKPIHEKVHHKITQNCNINSHKIIFMTKRIEKNFLRLSQTYFFFKLRLKIKLIKIWENIFKWKTDPVIVRTKKRTKSPYTPTVIGMCKVKLKPNQCKFNKKA